MLTSAPVLINGLWEDPDDQLPVIEPSTGEIVGTVGWARRTDATRAADAAAAAFPGWAELPARRRADLLHEATRLITERHLDIAAVLAREAGKRLPEARAEVAFAAEYFRWFAEEARRPQGALLTPETTSRRHLTLRRPAGVVASLSPWNFPCSIQARKLAPALAAGCTVVARVSEKAPLAVTELFRCLHDAGLPRGVFNLVHGPAAELTTALLRHKAVRVVTFTGSTAVGRLIMEQAAGRILRPLLELGGNAAFIVFDDADLDAAVEGAMLAKFRNTGQSCLAANRFHVHQSIYDAFVERLVARIDAMTLGDGTADPCPDLAPVIDADRAAAVNSLVDDALSRGATRLSRRHELPERGSYVEPSLLTAVPPDAALVREEVFGPTAAVTPFTSEEEVLANANSSEVGLAGYLWSRDASRCWRVAERLEVGVVGVNDPLPSVAFAPMGGVKQSGLGREGADLGLHEFEDTRYLAWGSPG